MNLELRPFSSIDYKQISELFMKALYYKRELKEDDFVIFTPEYAEYSVNMAFPDLSLFFGIYQGEKLVGTIGATTVQCYFQGDTLTGSVINTYAIDPDILPLERDTIKNVLQALIEKLKERQVDFVWVMIIKENNAFELKIFKEDLQFTQVHKNVESLVKLLGSEGVNILRKKKDLNVVLAQMAKMMAGMDKMPLPGGAIRDATPNDYSSIIELLNGYTQTLELAQYWSPELFQHYVDSSFLINSMDFTAVKQEFPNTPFGFHIKVWEKNSQIVASILYRVVCINFKNGDAPFCFCDYFAFSPKLTFEEKKAFLVNFYNELHLKAIIMTIFLPYYDFKTFDKSGFMTERRKTPLLFYSLTDKGAKLLELEKLKEFYLPTLLDFAI